MESIKDVIEMDLNGKVTSKQGQFENESEEKLQKLTKNIFYILQDITNIKNKNQSLGKFHKLTIKAGDVRYEIAVGSTIIKIFKFNQS